MIGEPPVLNPSFHVRPIRAALVIAVLSANPIGDEGTSTMIAPLPGRDSADSPYRFVAVKIAITLSPYTRLYGTS